MRLVSTIAAILVAIAVPSHAQEQLTVGNSYSGNVKLSSPNGGVYLALPEGQWVLASLENARNNPINSGDFVPVIKGRFLQTDEHQRITGLVGFDSGIGSKAGWETPRLCSRTDAFFLHADVQNRGRREKNCWAVHASALAVPGANAPQYVRDFHQYVTINKLRKPQSTISVQYYRSSFDRYLLASYYFVPETEGFGRSGVSTWRKEVVIGNPKRVAYLDSKKAWGEQWQPIVEAAYNGRPK